jgi:hypothetical protein
MKSIRIFITVVVVFIIGTWSVLEASFSRVESMGKHATFFMDDVSIFDNAANINVFPNFLIGEMGGYLQGDVDKEAAMEHALDPSTAHYYLPKYNRDPEDPWFGGIFSYSLNKKEEGNLYPQISIGGAFNRKDMELLSLLPDSVISMEGGTTDTNVVPDPVTNFDGFLGFTLANGGMVGTHVYVALQEGANVINGEPDQGAFSHKIATHIYKGDLGFNWPLARNVDGEFAIGFASIEFGDASVEPVYSFSVKARSFSTLELINGELVPIVSYNALSGPGNVRSNFDVGIGINASLDRGFFWLGLEGVFHSMEKTGYSILGNKEYYDATAPETDKEKELIQGGRISFGIERNIWWDWLVLRVGGQKLIAHREKKGVSGENYYITTNPISNGSIDDHVGFGIGLNIEERLKVDATVAEDFIYSGGNLLSGPQHHVISRISATYSF